MAKGICMEVGMLTGGLCRTMELMVVMSIGKETKEGMLTVWGDTSGIMGVCIVGGLDVMVVMSMGRRGLRRGGGWEGR